MPILLRTSLASDSLRNCRPLLTSFACSVLSKSLHQASPEPTPGEQKVLETISRLADAEAAKNETIQEIANRVFGTEVSEELLQRLTMGLLTSFAMALQEGGPSNAVVDVFLHGMELGRELARVS